MKAIYNDDDVQNQSIATTANHTFTVEVGRRYLISGGHQTNDIQIKIPSSATNIVHWDLQRTPLVYKTKAGQTSINILNNNANTINISVTKLS